MSDYEYRPHAVGDLSGRYLRVGDGRISGYLALFLGAMSWLAVLCFRHPALLTTPELRQVYDPETLRLVLLTGMWLPFGPLRYAIVTPQFHHWHHSREDPAIDTNYAVHVPLWDWLFGTLHLPGAHWPAHYGTVAPVPATLTGQLLHPFRRERA